MRDLRPADAHPRSVFRSRSRPSGNCDQLMRRAAQRYGSPRPRGFAGPRSIRRSVIRERTSRWLGSFDDRAGILRGGREIATMALIDGSIVAECSSIPIRDNPVANLDFTLDALLSLSLSLSLSFSVFPQLGDLVPSRGRTARSRQQRRFVGLGNHVRNLPSRCSCSFRALWRETRARG